jgi:hypothetical protein
MVANNWFRDGSFWMAVNRHGAVDLFAYQAAPSTLVAFTLHPKQGIAKIHYIFDGTPAQLQAHAASRR